MKKYLFFITSGIIKNSRTFLSTYADDITVFVNNTQDDTFLSDAFDVYEKASSSKVNWDKSEALWVGQVLSENLPKLPGNLKWRF